MESLFNINGLMFWNEDEIRQRRYFSDSFAYDIKKILLEQNKAWTFFECEAPLINPRSILNQNYTNEDIWVQETDELNSLALRPETTPGSYVYAEFLMDHEPFVKPPFVVYQSGKSFRREQDQVTKNMRLKEFYQQEFQCIYASDTLNDYQEAVLEPLRAMFNKYLSLPTRIVESDRLPSYSLRTMDIEVDNGDKWMEICSISKRTDFTTQAKFQNKGKLITKDCLVLEIAIGLDRCIYNYFDKFK